MKIMICVTNKAINAFQQGKQAKQEILHSVTKVLHVTPLSALSGSFWAGGTRSVVQAVFSDTGPQSSKCFVFSMFILFSQSEVTINRSAGISELVAQMCSSPKVRQSSESFVTPGTAFWRRESLFLQGCLVPQTTHRWITTSRPFYKVHLCAVKIYSSHNTNTCARSNTHD